MLKCGDYTLDRPVGWGRTATYYTAFGGEEAGDLRLVVRYSRSAERSHVQSFLKSAAEQQTAISSGCRRVAPVLDFGVAETGHAYRVNLGCEISLAELIQAGNTVDHETLRNIISGTLRALTELRDKFRRPHGNLSAGNILLDRNGEVLLTDLAPTAHDGRHSDDLRSLGAIIYQVVRQSLKIGFLAPPLERSPEWTNVLGEHADDWRELTNRLLLTKTGEGAASLERAVKELKALATLGEHATVVPSTITGPASTITRGDPSTTVPTPRARKRRLRLAVAALTLVVIASIATFVLWKNEKTIKTDAEDPTLPPVSYFKKFIPAASTAKFEGGIITRLNGAGTPREIWDLLTLDWRAPVQLRKLQEEWQKPPRAWTALAEQISPPPEIAIDPGMFSQERKATWPSDVETLANVLQKMVATENFLASAEALEKQWGRVEDLCAQINEEKESARVGFPDFSAWARYTIGESDNLQEAGQRAAAMITMLREMQKFLREDAPRVHQASMRNSVASIPAFSDPAFRKAPQLWPQRWVDEAKKVVRPKAATLEKWEELFKDITTRIRRRPDRDKEKPLFAKELEELRTASVDVLERDQDQFTSRLEALRAKIKDPLEDLDAEFWARAKKLYEDLSKAGDSEAAKGHVQPFVDDVRDMLRQPEYVPVTAGFLLRNNFLDTDSIFGALLKGREKRGEPQFNFRDKSRFTTWEKTLLADGSGITLRAPAGEGGHVITFHIVEGTSVALAATETSLALAKAAGIDLGTPRSGPLGFREDVNRKGSQKWFWPDVETWLREVAAKRLKPVDIPRHTDIDNCPVTWVSARTAFRVAQTLGARLPTTAEWTTAAAQQPTAAARLRVTGGVFDRLQTAINAFESDSSITPFALNAGSCTLLRGTGYGGRVETDAYPWFVPVYPDPAKAAAFGKFPHLIGNAAEWALNIEAGKTTPFLAGGSCLSPPSSQILVPSPSELDKPFSDVTFRLAVDFLPGAPNAALTAIVAAADELLKKRPTRQ
jgi:hypothetical protein